MTKMVVPLRIYSGNHTTAKKHAKPKKHQTTNNINSHPPKKASEMSQDEAALVIQKQFRGYQARKQYGPLITSEKMSDEMTSFMKAYCRKWKAKSLFQVLLMYRAMKYQETVYMSQQVHLYNQNAVSALQQTNKERVILGNINQDTTPAHFLGKYTPRAWKLPFRLNDMPFCDSSYLTNTMGKRTLTKDPPWNDPYMRRSRIMSATGTATGLENTGLNVEEGGDVFGFIQTPYTRDPNYIEVIYSGQPYRKGDHYFTSKNGKDRRNSRKKSAAPRAPQLSPNHSIPDSQSLNNPVFYQPPHPSTNFVNQQWNYSDTGKNDYRDKLKMNPSSGNPNPMHELQMKFRQVNNNNYGDNGEDTPTFNFQAMLRKTNHNRASLRRSPEIEMSLNHGHGSYPAIPEKKSVNNHMNNNVAFNSSLTARNVSQRPLMRQDSGDCRKMMSHHYKESVKRAQADEVTTEIAPGIIIQGHIAEL